MAATIDQNAKQRKAMKDMKAKSMKAKSMKAQKSRKAKSMKVKKSMKAKSMKVMKAATKQCKKNTWNHETDFDILSPPYSSFLRELFNSRELLRMFMHKDKACQLKWSLE